MVVSGQDRVTEGSVRCPTCKARQEWSDTCRRCKCDLADLREVAAASRWSARRCLLLIRAGRLSGALREARRCWALNPGKRSARLLAVCYFLRGEWAKAIAVSQFADE